MLEWKREFVEKEQLQTAEGGGGKMYGFDIPSLPMGVDGFERNGGLQYK